MLSGLVRVAAGWWAFVMPGLTAFAPAVLIGAWALVHGALAIVAALRCARISTMSGG